MGRGIALLFHDRGTSRGWVVSSTPRPHFAPGKDPAPIFQEAGWAPEPVWTGGKSRPHRDSIPDRPARSQSLYRLSYPAHVLSMYCWLMPACKWWQSTDRHKSCWWQSCEEYRSQRSRFALTQYACGFTFECQLECLLWPATYRSHVLKRPSQLRLFLSSHLISFTAVWPLCRIVAGNPLLFLRFRTYPFTRLPVKKLNLHFSLSSPLFLIRDGCASNRSPQIFCTKTVSLRYIRLLSVRKSNELVFADLRSTLDIFGIFFYKASM